MAISARSNSDTPEGEAFEEKSSLDPTSREHMLGLIADVVAMANTAGGAIWVGEKGKSIPEAHKALLDSARLDDSVNSFVEPRVRGIRSKFASSEVAVIEVEKSSGPPHVFTKDGNYADSKNRQSALFRRGDVLVRHSSKTERASRSDYDRWAEENRRRLLDNVKMVIEAGPTARVQVSESNGFPVRIDPNAADAQPIYDLLTPDPFRDLNQELIGGIKSWRTSGQLFNENQIFKAYRERDKVVDSLIIELLLRSCWEHHLPGYCWASKLTQSKLYSVVEEAITANGYFSTMEALRVASLLPRELAKALLRLTEASERKSEKRLSAKLDAVVRARTQKQAVLAHLYNSGPTVKFKTPEGSKEVKRVDLGVEIFEEILSTLPQELKVNRSPFRLAELLTFGESLTKTQIDEGQENVVGSSAHEDRGESTLPITESTS